MKKGKTTEQRLDKLLAKQANESLGKPMVLASDIESHGTGIWASKVAMDEGIIWASKDYHATVIIADDGLLVSVATATATTTFPIQVHHSLAAAVVAANTWLEQHKATSVEVHDNRKLKLTSPQEMALLRKWNINSCGMTYHDFRLSVTPEIGSKGCVMVHWCNMWLGVETDGHTHS